MLASIRGYRVTEYIGAKPTCLAMRRNLPIPGNSAATREKSPSRTQWQVRAEIPGAGGRANLNEFFAESPNDHVEEALRLVQDHTDFGAFRAGVFGEWWQELGGQLDLGPDPRQLNLRRIFLLPRYCLAASCD
jgi:hypothetical protein